MCIRDRFWACVEYDEALKQYVYRSALIANPLQEDTAVIPLGKTLDLRWIDLLTGQRNVEKGLFKKTTVTVYGAEDPLGSSVPVSYTHLDPGIEKRGDFC